LPGDAALLKDAIDSSLAELQEWMPWARSEPSELGAIAERLERFRAEFLGGQDWAYGMFDPRGAIVLGGAGLHPRIGPRALEMGYWVRTAATGRGLATEAVAALTRVGFELFAVERIEIHCDPRNTRSAAIPRRLGFAHTETRQGVDRNPDGLPRDTMVWTLRADSYRSAQSTWGCAEAFDANDRRVL
jgi:RimJ/RimL family protein N-acetyltransferase